MVIEVSAIEVAKTTLRRPVGEGEIGAILFASIEGAEEFDNVDIRFAQALLQQLTGTADLTGARQKHQQRAGFGTQSAFHRIHHLTLNRPTGIAAQITGFNRKRAALAFDRRRIAEQRRNPRTVERRRHHQ